MQNISEKIDMAVRKIIALGGSKVRFIILYGSACEGRMKEDSDIDISVYYDDADAYEFRLKSYQISLMTSMTSKSSSSFRFRYECRF
jgi:uncharacterized protein